MNYEENAQQESLKMQAFNIEDARSMLAALPAKARPLSHADALKMMLPELNAARLNGYSNAELSEFLKARGLKISARAIGAVLASNGSKPKRGRKRRDVQALPTPMQA